MNTVYTYSTVCACVRVCVCVCVFVCVCVCVCNSMYINSMYGIIILLVCMQIITYAILLNTEIQQIQRITI